jgi:hypothetical protein
MVACKTELTRVVGSQFVGQTIRASIVHTEAAASIDANGNPREAKTFANVWNELPLEDAPAAETKPAAKTPPVMNKPAAAKPANGAPRRA